MLKSKVNSGDGDDHDNVDEVLVEQRDHQSVSLKNYKIKKTPTIKIPQIFMNPNDITQWREPFYNVSDFCISEFQARTNFQTLEHRTQYYGGGLVSCIISRPAKRMYCPIYQFKYKSVQQESYLKNLALLPNIKSKKNHEEYLNFYRNHDLKECYIDMNKNNIAKQFSDKIISNFLKKHSERKIWNLMPTITNEILNAYYESKNIRRKKLFARELTMEDMLMYSNIEFVANKLIAKYPNKKQDLDTKMKEIFQKYHFGIEDEDECSRHLKFNPYYKVIDPLNNRDQTTMSSSSKNAQPSISNNISFEFKNKPKVGTYSNKRVALTDNLIDLTIIDEEQEEVQQIVEQKEVVVTSCFEANEDYRRILMEIEEEEEDEETEDEKTEDEVKFNTIFENLNLDGSSSLVICIRDIIQSQKYLTATDWRNNMQDYVYDFLKTNMSLDILNFVNDYSTTTKDHITYLIKDYLKINTDTETSYSTPQLSITQPEITPLPQLEIMQQQIIPKVETNINNTDQLIVFKVKQETCNEIIVISSDSEDEFNMNDDTIAKTISDMYLKDIEQGATQEEIPVIADVPMASCSKAVDSNLESSYASLTYQAHIDDERVSRKRKIQSSMNQPAAKLSANKENMASRKNDNVAVVVVPKCRSSRNIFIQDSSDEIVEPKLEPGNIDFQTHINEVLNHEFSVFLSSQIVSSGCDNERDNNENNIIHVPSINFTKQLNSDVNNLKPSAACFIVNIVSVKFQKDVLFQVTLNIPQFNFYSIDIENGNIKIFLNLNPIEWKTLKDLLNLAVNYMYVKQKKENVQKSSKNDSNIFTILLDKYFDTLTSFKTFYLNSHDNSLVCYNADGVPSCLNYDLSSIVSPSVLETIKRLKATGSST